MVDLTVSTEPLFKRFLFAASVTNVLDRKIVDDAPRPDRMPGYLPASERTFHLRAEIHL